ncbi:hypothetical protein DLREEDagrD3_11530 [Denitratisoma sp. agr-D3]
MLSLNPEKLLENRLSVQRAILFKAQQDLRFRAALKADPKGALKEFLGVNWDPRVKLEVIEESDDRCVLVLPPVIGAEAANDELSDADLELVSAGASGGQTPTCYVNRYGVEKCGSDGNNGG